MSKRRLSNTNRSNLKEQKAGERLNIVELGKESMSTAIQGSIPLPPSAPQPDLIGGQNVQQREIRNPNMVRKRHHTILYILVLVCFICQSIHEAVYFFGGRQPANSAMLLTPSLVCVILSLIVSCAVVSCRQMLGYFVMIDNILLICLAADLVFIVFEVSFSVVAFTPVLKGLRILAYPLMNWFISGMFRILMVHVLWNKAQVIIFKLMLILCAGFQIYTGMFMTIVMHRVDDQSAATSMVILITCSNFSMILQFFSKITDIDGSNNFRRDYILVSQHQDKNVVLGMLDLDLPRERRSSLIQKSTAIIRIQDLQQIQ